MSPGSVPLRGVRLCVLVALCYTLAFVSAERASANFKSATVEHTPRTVPPRALLDVLFPWGTEALFAAAEGNPISHALGQAFDLTDLFPESLAFLQPDTPLKWKGPCFTANSALLIFDASDGAAITINTTNTSEASCDEAYLLVTSYNFQLVHFATEGNHLVQWPPMAEGERLEVQRHGIQLLQFRQNYSVTMDEMMQLARMLLGGSTEGFDFAGFLGTHAGMAFPSRAGGELPLRLEDIKNGDLFFTFQMSFEDLIIAWFTGSPLAHVVAALWEGSTLYVVETLRGNSQNGVQRTPFAQWLAYHRSGNYSVAWTRPALPGGLTRFDNATAWGRYQQLSSTPYAVQILATVVIDTVAGNLPPPLSPQSLRALIAVAGKMAPQLAQAFAFDAFNTRFRNLYASKLPVGWKNCTNLGCVQATADSLGTDLLPLLALPEQDSWRYNLGQGYPASPALVCSVFAMHILKAGGVLGGTFPAMNFAEFSPKDLSQLQVFQEGWEPAYCPTPRRGWCQVTGSFEMSLPGFNSILPYPDMNERCQALPLKYTRTPPNC